MLDDVLYDRYNAIMLQIPPKVLRAFDKSDHPIQALVLLMASGVVDDDQ